MKFALPNGANLDRKILLSAPRKRATQCYSVKFHHKHNRCLLKDCLHSIHTNSIHYTLTRAVSIFHIFVAPTCVYSSTPVAPVCPVYSHHSRLLLLSLGLNPSRGTRRSLLGPPRDRRNSTLRMSWTSFLPHK